ncbi:MAG: 16S rRNA processing protein RimM [Candidatus Eremiobacteraeota bacterium]|nr:16S rRNA processing protein RimM [Candidatus Eremiobacteraeota bacterium]
MRAGSLGAPHGLHGELTCRPSPVGADAIAAGATLYLDPAPFHDEHVRVASARMHHGKLLLRLEGVATPEHARALNGRNVWLRRNDVVLGRDEYLDEQLIGLRIVDTAERELGTVAVVRHFPAQDCLVVDPGGGIVPMVREFIKAIDLESARIIVDVPPGLLDESLAEEA